ncbi:hypothetical protein BSKO_01349 [Bryopsis sp. KO-2023]|nr:hypothetical protein BSKO_01349 [Bryopsis sp. KO-2023]
MPPKKKGKGKTSDPAKFVDKERVKRAEAEIISLQRLLEVRSHEALEARRSERQWRERGQAFSEVLESQKQETRDITSDMLRQYKAMQDKFVKKVSDLEEKNATLRSQLSVKDEEIQVVRDEKDELKRKTDSEITEYRRKLSDMQHEFADMLKETLDKMHERLESANADQDV